jgi:hypothetical protein
VTAAAAQLLFQSEEARKLWARVIDGFVEDAAAAIELERERGAAPPGPPARQLAIALNRMNERVLLAAYTGQEPMMADDALLETLTTIWSRAIYSNDFLA